MNILLTNCFGCGSIGVGVEYLSDTVLNGIRKGITVSDIFRVVELVQKHNMYAHFSIIDFNLFVNQLYVVEHMSNLQRLFGKHYNKLSFSLSTLDSNPALNKALLKMR